MRRRGLEWFGILRSGPQDYLTTMKSPISIVPLVALLCSCNHQPSNTPPKSTVTPPPTSFLKDAIEPPVASSEADRFVYADSTYLLPSGSLTIQSSYPKGGGAIEQAGAPGFTDPTGRNHAYVVFWHHLRNETDEPMDVELSFPADSFAIFASPDAYLKLFFPSDSMSFDKVSEYNYGIQGLSDFLDTNFYEPTASRTLLQPTEAALFYVAALTYHPRSVSSARAALVFEGEELFYRIEMGPDGAGSIPCGRIRLAG